LQGCDVNDDFHPDRPRDAGGVGARPSASLVVVRDGPRGIETLLLRRAERGDQNSGAWVFPGGLVDAGDRAAHACCTGLDDAGASARLTLAAGGLDYAVAALRECFEECGLLYAVGADGEPVDPSRPEVAAWRPLLHRGGRGIDEMCRELGLRLQASPLVYLSHWVTPLGRPKRFDTRFFVARAPAGQSVVPDGHEVTEHRWMCSKDALAAAAGLKLMTPTHKTLELIGTHANVDALLAWAGAQRSVPLVMPRMGTGREGLRPVVPDEPAYAELGRIDPAGRGHGCYDIRPGVPVRLSERVIRVTADNGSVMTGPGTNAYLLRSSDDTWTVIDPGPEDAAHTQAILAAAPGPITRILVTHTHIDHSPGCRALQALTGATVYGRVADFPEGQDEAFVPEQRLDGGERLALASDCTLRVIHTPGHASNHLCFLLEQEKMLFTGDHVMQLSTVVINPPDGDMAAYLASLRALRAEDLEWLAPGHGFLMAHPARTLEAIIAHRLRREEKVVQALRGVGGPATLQALLAHVYADVPVRMHPVALRSLTAHLRKLRDEGRAAESTDGRWSPA
jgi:glyoxylase-like metal-dependent hydrolase (beta-lactamase superfamily II)/8-oxo-dGTP pyrophosphatase MutT (NUDIX family)